MADSNSEPRPDELSRRERDLLYTLLENIPEFVFFKDLEGRYERISRSLARFYGLDEAGDAEGKTDSDFCPAENARAAERDEAELIRTGQPLIGKEERCVAATGQIRWLSTSKVPITDREGRATGIIGLSRDVTERKRAEAEHQAVHQQLLEHAEELETSRKQLEFELAHRMSLEDRMRHLAFRDQLTNLPNRWLLMDRLNQCVKRAQRDPGYHYAILFLDFDNFSMVTNSLGHDAGDALLVQAAERLSDCMRNLDMVVRSEADAAARLGGDEFSVLLEGLRNPDDAVLVAERIRQRLAPPYALNGRQVVMSSSVGIATSNGREKAAEELLREADTAMYRAKQSGKGRHAVFDQAMHAEAVARLQLENDLRATVERNDFELHYQPIVVLESGELAGFEALIRWHHPERDMVSPLEFIPAAEKNGLIVPIGRWVIQEACARLVEWSRTTTGGELSISVNVSKRQMLEPGFVEGVAHTLRKTGVDGRRLKMEVTESVITEDPDNVIEILTQLRAMGIELYMDDFGTGLSSLSHLHRFPIDVLKIDRSFVSTVAANREYAAVVQAISTLAQNLGMKLIAEGIETLDQHAQMIALECDFGQGYLFSQPVDADAATGLIAAGRFQPAVPAEGSSE